LCSTHHRHRQNSHSEGHYFTFLKEKSRSGNETYEYSLFKVQGLITISDSIQLCENGFFIFANMKDIKNRRRQIYSIL
jgi:hypothetical protein